MQHFPYQVALVGENPLPVYLGIKQFSDPADDRTKKIVLVHSDGTKAETDAIIAMFPNSDGKFARLELRDPRNPHKIYESLQTHLASKLGDAEHLKDSILNYTGGTKVMSVTAVRFCMTNPNQTSICYADEPRRKFLFGTDGVEADIQAEFAPLELFKLHGLLDPTKKSQKTFTEEQLEEILKVVCASDYSTQEYRKGKLKGESDPRNTNGGEWLEAWIERLILTLPARSENDHSWKKMPSETLLQKENIFANVEFRVQEHSNLPGKCDFESDILVVNQQRLRYLSLSVSEEAEKCKGKMFEALHHGRRLGGDAASVALVCLGKEQAGKKRFSTFLQASMGLTDIERHCIFDRHDVIDWYEGDTSSLRKFLTN